MIFFIVFVIPAGVIWLVKKVFFAPRKVYDLKDKVVLITGASSGLGEGIFRASVPVLLFVLLHSVTTRSSIVEIV